MNNQYPNGYRPDWNEDESIYIPQSQMPKQGNYQQSPVQPPKKRKSKGMLAVIITIIALMLVAAVLATVLVIRTKNELEDRWEARQEEMDEEEEEDDDRDDREDRPAADAPVAEAPAADAPVAEAPAADAPAAEAPAADAPAAVEEDVMTYEAYVAAELDTLVTVDCYVQRCQSWWNDTINVYAADRDGGYFIYELACSEEEAAKLTSGTKIRVTGYKTEWAGEIEIVAGTFQFLGDDTYIAKPVDLTNLLGSDELLQYQNRLVSFRGLTVEEIRYKNNKPGDDIYLYLSRDGVSWEFYVEVYLTGPESEVYTTVGMLSVGDVVDVEGFLYWYEGISPHITAISLA